MPPKKFSQGIEKVLALAAMDKDFHKRLLSDRASALETSPVDLTESETAVLLSISDEQLVAAIRKVDVPEPARRAFLKGAVVTALAVIGSTFIFTSTSSGSIINNGPYLPASSFTMETLAGYNCVVHKPNGYVSGTPIPALLWFHGQDKDVVGSYLEWSEVCNNGNFAYCGPEWSGFTPADFRKTASDAFGILSALNGIVTLKTDQLYIGGFGIGGGVALESALAVEDSWAAAVSWAGLMLDGTDPGSAPRKDMAIYLAAAQHDLIAPTARMTALRDLLQGLGFPVSYNEVPGLHYSHNFSPSATWNWISGHTYP
ncbi:MAG: alpha/beta hydrolase [Planctomycetota bacterium]